MQEHQQPRQYGSQAYGVDDQLMAMAMTTYDSSAPITAHATLFDAPHLIIDAPQDGQKHRPYRYTPPGSPSNSASHSLDHPPSTMSSTSGASAQSASSSAVGSPYSRSIHTVSSRDAWTESGYGLGIGPGIVSHDGFYQGDYVNRNLEHEIMFGQEKLPSAFVGKSVEVSSSQAPVSSVLSSLSLSNSFRHTFVPALAPDTSVGKPAMTIDTILQEVESEASTPRLEPSPDSVRPKEAGVDVPWRQDKNASSSESEAIRSPSTAASATPPSASSARSLPFARSLGSRTHPAIESGVKKVKSSPKASPGRFHYGRPTPPPSSPTMSSAGQVHTPFFSQSSGNFVAPLESSCWFSYAALCNLPRT